MKNNIALIWTLILNFFINASDNKDYEKALDKIRNESEAKWAKEAKEAFDKAVPNADVRKIILQYEGKFEFDSELKFTTRNQRWSNVALAFSNNSRYLACALSDCHEYCFRIFDFKGKRIKYSSQNRGWLKGITFSLDDKYLALGFGSMSGKYPLEIMTLDFQNQVLVKESKGLTRVPPINYLLFNEMYLFFAPETGGVTIWDINNDKLSLVENYDLVLKFAVANNKNFLATIQNVTSRDIAVLDLDKKSKILGKLLNKRSLEFGNRMIKYSPDSKYLFVLGGNENKVNGSYIYILDGITLELKNDIKDNEWLYSFDLSSDERFCATASKNKIKIYSCYPNIMKFNLLQIIDCEQTNPQILFSPDSKYVVSTSMNDGNIKIWRWAGIDLE